MVVQQKEWLLLFSGLPGGYRNNNGNWWSATENNTNNAWNRNLNYNNTNINRNNNNKEYGFSVRCLRDLKTVGVAVFFWVMRIPIRKFYGGLETATPRKPHHLFEISPGDFKLTGWII